MAALPGSTEFVLRLGLQPVPASIDDVLAEIGSRLDAFDPQMIKSGHGLDLWLIIAAGDLWLAVLTAMAAITDTGYVVVDLDAHRTALEQG